MALDLLVSGRKPMRGRSFRLALRPPAIAMACIALTASLLLAACGGSDGVTFADGDASTDGGGGGDARSDAPRDAVSEQVKRDGGGPIACNGSTCSATQYCVQPCCGGAGPFCEPLPDSGTCPSGTHLQVNCRNGTGPGCESDPCKPPPPYCSDSVPTGCQVGSDGSVVCLCA